METVYSKPEEEREVQVRATVDPGRLPCERPRAERNWRAANSELRDELPCRLIPGRASVTLISVSTTSPASQVADTPLRRGDAQVTSG
jgi:hypothetical protein